MRLILASQSPFRKKALDLLGLKYKVIPSYFDEKSIRDPNPETLSRKLSEAKARKIGQKEKDAIIIAADYFIVFDNKIYEKPLGKSEAKQMLKLFSGKSIDNVCSICVYNSKTGKILSAVEHCITKFRELSDFELDDYISRYPVTTFAGAFDTDGVIRFSDWVKGEPLFVFGLPVSKMILFLRKMGVKA